ncbi:hypothetical protein DQ04_00301150 [Trypanosoma grayi]|uniref:hypothetical protein n=1 Tax=Trypanosoma grayi TaxID=71804 RepID=UPI0004F43EBD|nr:hypothetical protein DQ04_00301150 [Trypanosoma grayi]KEG14805.1 hypothetical protein DQ04_00301150 [Trypanosoma grayi]
MAHRLVLPLPPAFAAAGGGTDEGYSVFAYNPVGDDGVCVGAQQQLQAYIDRLGEFLHRTRLIQYHPEDFFRFLLGMSDDAGDGSSAVLSHLDGSAVREEEVRYMRELCEAFAALVPSDDAFIKQMHRVIREGPPAGAAACLQSFFAETKALQLNRRRRRENDAARLTLRTEDDAALPQRDAAQQQRCKRVMAAVLGYGMGPKKQHEVVVMRDTTMDLVDCCNTAAECGTSLLEPVETVVNVGEGKGYVSRALALCDGLQVIGLDCNPSHKERVVERVEFLLQGRLGVDTAQQELTGRDMLNLLYEPRGHMATIACRVGLHMNWADVLRGHVRICDAASPFDGVVPISPEAMQDDGEDAVKAVAAAEVKAEELTDVTGKVQCRVCSQIIRRSGAASIVRHTLCHLNAGHTAGCTELPSRDAVDEWNRNLPVEAFANRIIATFFTDKVVYARKEGTDAAALSVKRPRRETSATRSGANNAREKLQDVLDAYRLASNVRLPRGMRAEVLLPVQQQQQQEEERGGGEDTDAVPAFVYSYTPVCLTIVGYDCAPNRHFVILDDGKLKEACVLVQRSDGTRLKMESSPEELDIPPAKDAWSLKLAVLLRVLPPAPPRTPIVRVPELRNTVMIGLHPCGDLGSNVCRLFTESASRGLLLVSCCWHALTNDGFPLSRELQRRGWRTEQISLLLATQPLDMWATASAEGHRGSARLLFYRSLLKVLWHRLRERWQHETVAAAGCCRFVEVPHLEPAFLRRIAKMKDTVTLEELYLEVCREYFFEATAKQTPYTWQHRVCVSCRASQERFLAAHSSVSLAAEMGREYFAAHFASFLGLTVLRMWMSHLVETLLLLDRAFYLAEELRRDERCRGSVVSLVPLFDGAVSPRMYGILARRIPVS